MFKKIKSVSDVVSWRLCVGCGACFSACKNHGVILVNFTEHGIRPVCNENCKQCGECLKVCSGLYNIKYNSNNGEKYIKELIRYCGHTLEVWEGYASDGKLRECCSSGGIATALALYYMENKKCAGVIHTKFKTDKPWLNETVMSNDTTSILKAVGSRYAPASPCDGFCKLVEKDKNYVFIGKPCDISALRNTQIVDSEMSDKIGLAIGIFCAGTPSTKATLDLMTNNSIDFESIDELHYRGKGWPGSFHVKVKGKEIYKTPYPDSWSFLQKYRPFRCYLCADGTSENADISCGDAWYLRGKEDKGISLILVRNERGREILHNAMKRGYITARLVNYKRVIESQEQLFGKQREIWGRLLALKTLGLPVPNYDGWPLFRNWISLPLKIKVTSILSTLKRILLRKLYKPLKIKNL